MIYALDLRAIWLLPVFGLIFLLTDCLLFWRENKTRVGFIRTSGSGISDTTVSIRALPINCTIMP